MYVCMYARIFYRHQHAERVSAEGRAAHEKLAAAAAEAAARQRRQRLLHIAATKGGHDWGGDEASPGAAAGGVAAKTKRTSVRQAVASLLAEAYFHPEAARAAHTLLQMQGEERALAAAASR